MPDKNYPELIASLPDADLSLDGVKAKLLQGEGRQVVFFELQTVAQIPVHSHGAQWGIVVDGEIELTIGGETKVYRKGDSYTIPAGVEHGAKVLTPAKVIDIFADADRYKPKA